MENNKNFLAYINNPLSKESIAIIYDSNNIKYEKCELYGDFIKSLILLVFDTYLGDEFMDYDNKNKHFNWCWDKVINDFKDEGFYFSNPSLHRYFRDYIFESFYNVPNKEELGELLKSNLKLWIVLFGYENIKTNFDMDVLVDLYNMFNNSITVKTIN